MRKDELSLAQKFALLPKEQRDKILESMTPQQLEELRYDWNYWGRPKQLMPLKEDDWSVWLNLAGRGWGKALCKSLKINTLQGWKTLGDVQIGDYVFDEQGLPTKVLDIFDIIPDKAYRFYFNDGTFIDSCADHFWATWTARDRKQYLRHSEGKNYPTDWVLYTPKNLKSTNLSYKDYYEILYRSVSGESVKSIAKGLDLNIKTVTKVVNGDYDKFVEKFGTYKTTQEIVDSLKQGKRGDSNHCIFNTKPLQYEYNEDIEGFEYWLGLFIGDGLTKGGDICGLESDVQEYKKYFENLGYECSVRTVTRYEGKPLLHLKVLDAKDIYKKSVVNNKKVLRDEYLRSSVAQRLLILKGLMDSAGYIENGGLCEFSQSDETIANQVYELIISLGMKATITSRIPVNSTNGVEGKLNWRIRFNPTMQVFNLARKAKLLKLEGNQFGKRFHRMIVKAEEIEPVPMRCLTVDSPKSMFLIGKQMIPTRNSRAALEWVNYKAESHPGCLIAIVGPTAQSVYRTMVTGSTGLLSITRPNALKYERSKAQITWKNGSVAFLYSSENPDRLRGPSHHYALADEIVAWKNPETWDMLQLTLRIGKNPQTMIATTPKPTELILNLIGGESEVDRVNSSEVIRKTGITIVRGTTFENTMLSKKALENYLNLYGNTATGDQELYAKLLLNIHGALWKRDWIIHWNDGLDTRDPDAILAHMSRPRPEFVRTVVGVDPATTANSHSDLTGITVASQGVDGKYYIRESVGLQVTPSAWAEEVVKLFKKYNADKIVAERNNGGMLVENTLRMIQNYRMNGKTYKINGMDLPIETVHAKQGKYLRAEEVALLYEQRRVIHMETFADLESQMLVFKGEPNGADDLVDSMVYAMRELTGERIVEYHEPAVAGIGLVSDRLGGYGKYR